MALTDTFIKAAKPRQKNWKLADEKGLYLLITPAGGKLWKVKFRHLGKEKKLSLGAYPDVSLAKARKLRDAAREQLAEGLDPALDRKKAKFAARLSAGVSLRSEWARNVFLLVRTAAAAHRCGDARADENELEQHAVRQWPADHHHGGEARGRSTEVRRRRAGDCSEIQLLHVTLNQRAR